MTSLADFAGSQSLRDKYCVEEAHFLGRGKFSVAHRTRRRADGLAVALKTVQVFEMGSNERNECMNEIRLLQSMQNPHIITYLDCILEDNELTVVMELAEHGDLAGLIGQASAPFQERRVWEYGCQICDALRYMHERRVMHRDVKPANVFITAEHQMKLGDLGLGRYFSSKTEQVHSTVGTPYYMSPECLQGGGYDFKSDIWSLGCLLYELTTLRSPFYSDGVNLYILGKRIKERKFQPIGDSYSPQLSELINSMLQITPADRPTATHVFDVALAAASVHGCSLPAASV